MPDALNWKLANAQAALKLVSNDELGKSSIDPTPIGLELESNLSFGGDTAKLALNIRGSLTVAALNDPTDPDEDGIVSGSGTDTPAGTLPPQLSFDRLYLKYRAEAGVKAKVDIPVGELIGIDVATDAKAVFADYRVHAASERVRAAIEADIKDPARFVTRIDDVLKLATGEALAFRFGGSVRAGVSVSVSDIFTGQIGSLAALLGTATPIAISVKAGATLALNVSVADDFLIVFSRVSEARWRVGVRKMKSSRVAPSADIGIDVGFDKPEQISELITGTLDAVLAAPLEKVTAALSGASLESLGEAERKIAMALIDRFGLNEVVTIEALRKRVEELEEKIGGVINNIVSTRIKLSFAYEYSRVSANTNLVQATMDRDALVGLHADVIKGRTESVAQAVRENRPGVALELYLNQKEISRTHSWGFTLGIGKWVTVGGKDFKKMSTIRRLDVQNRIQESYLGARAYKGTWVGESFEWGVDLKADMKDYAAEPQVNDFSLGIHLLWKAQQKKLTASELEQWIDSAAVWRVLREADTMETRARLVAALGQEATATVQIVIPNAAIRGALPALAAAPVAMFAPALATSMPWMNIPGRTNAALRRQLYAPLWAFYLDDPTLSRESYARTAVDHLRKEGQQDAATRELFGQSGPDPFTFNGLVFINGDTRGNCEAFTRGAGILHTAITSGARNQKTIEKAVREMDDLWAQSHHVRAIGRYLLDAAERAGFLAGVTRTLKVESPGLPDVVVTA